MLVEIKKLTAELKPYRKTIFIIAITGIAYAVASARIALLTKSLFDALSAANHQEILRLVPYAVGLALVTAVGRYYHIYLMNYIAECVVQNIRQKLQQKFMRLNLSFHNNYAAGSGGLISRILNDIRVIQDGLRVVADIFLHPLLFIFLIGNLFYIDWKLTLATMVMVPIVGSILKSIS
ncbi:MAG: ABC transporter transmembrane domain-containing protein, partial [Bdellovibrio sp.]